MGKIDLHRLSRILHNRLSRGWVKLIDPRSAETAEDVLSYTMDIGVLTHGAYVCANCNTKILATA